MTPGTKARIPLRQATWEVYEVVDVLPGGQVNLTREPHPLEKMWGCYANPITTANRSGITRVFCQVNSVKDLEVIK